MHGAPTSQACCEHSHANRSRTTTDRPKGSAGEFLGLGKFHSGFKGSAYTHTHTHAHARTRTLSITIAQTSIPSLHSPRKPPPSGSLPRIVEKGEAIEPFNPKPTKRTPCPNIHQLMVLTGQIKPRDTAAALEF